MVDYRDCTPVAAAAARIIVAMRTDHLLENGGARKAGFRMGISFRLGLSAWMESLGTHCKSSSSGGWAEKGPVQKNRR